MIQEINWNNFKVKFNGREQNSFEQLCYLLFCKEFGKSKGIPRFKNQAGIETDPIKSKGKFIGWQAKFYDTKLSEHKADFITTIDTTKRRHPNINKIIFYTNQEFGQDKKATAPKYKTNIDEYAKSKGIEIEWRTRSYFESPFVREKNLSIAQHYFNIENFFPNVFVLGPTIKENLIQFLTSNSDFKQNFIRKFLKGEEKEQVQSLYQSLGSLEVLKSSFLRNSNFEVEIEYDKIVRGNNMNQNADKIKYQVLNAATCVKNFEFDTAHKILGESLKLISSSDKQYKFVHKEYLITGFICYSRKNNIEGLRSLLQQESRYDEDLNAEYIMSMIFQEIFSRDIDLKSLRTVVTTLERIYDGSSNVMKPAMANSLGLAYRRLGEREGVIYLKKAINVFKKGLGLNNGNKKIEIELKDQMAITHVRMFEFTKKGHHLDTAEFLLKDCIESLKGPMDPRDYRLKPRVLNNLGNVFKQKALIFNDIKSGMQAINIYLDAEQYWNKNDAKYDWALLRKNIAETKYAIGKLTKDTKMLSESLRDCIAAIQYRNLKNSPYQWGKTVNVILLIVVTLHQLKSAKLVSKLEKTKILSYLKVIIENKGTWSKNISVEFVKNAIKTRSILL